MKKHFTYLAALTALLVVLIMINSNQLYLLNEPLLKTHFVAADLSDSYSESGVIIPVAYDSSHHNIFHINLKTNNIQNILGKFQIFSAQNLNLDFDQEYVLRTDAKGLITDALCWSYPDLDIKEVVPDSEGNIYIHAVEYDEYDALIFSESIYKYSPTNKKMKKVVDYRYADDQPFMTPNIRNVQPADEGIAYYYYAIDQQILRQYTYNTVLEMTFEKEVPDGMVFINLFGTQPGQIFFTTRENQVGLIADTFSIEISKDYLQEKTTIEDVFQVEDTSYIMTQSGKLDSYRVMNNLAEMGRLSSLKARSNELMEELNPGLEGVTKLAFSNALILKRLFSRVVLLAILALLTYILRFAYIYILQRKLWISLKMVLVLVPAISITVLFFTLFTILDTFSDVNDDIKDGKHIQFEHIIDYQYDRIAQEYDADYLTDYLESLESYGAMDVDKYVTFEEAISLKHVYNNGGALEENDIEDLNGMYLVVDVVKNGTSYKILDTENNYRWFTKRDPDNDYINRVMGGESIHDSTSDYIFTLKPIFNEQRDVVGILQVGMNYGGYKKENDENLLRKIVKSMLTIPSIMLPIIVLITFVTLRPIGLFTRDVKNINDENLDTQIEMATHDEIEDLSDAFNTMTANMNVYINDIKRMSESYHRFVPQEIFTLLNKEKVEEIQLGNNIQLNMTILCAGINHFYELSEKLGHEESFDMINQHLKVVGPIIRKHGGVIDRYLDIGVVAMFPEKTDDALKAAIDIQKTIQNLKKTTDDGYQDINIAIHKGDVLVGIIGEAKRLQSNMVSDIVNMCLLLQEKASLLASRILVSKEAYTCLEGRYNDRKLGAIKPMGRESSIEVIDVFEGDEKSIFFLKQQSSELFSHAVEEFKNGDYEKARSNFVRVLEKNINDSVARLYFYEVDQKLKQNEHEEGSEYQLSI